MTDCELLISRLSGGAQLTDDVRRRILAAADGNPLFIEEMLASLSEDGDHGEITVPPTIQALLQSRLDRLGPGERDMIGRGAVEGQVFHRSTVHELAPAAERDEVPGHLLSLVRKEMIRPDQPTYPRRGGLPLSPSADPRRRLRLASQGDASRAPRIIRRLARPACEPRRTGRDRRLPPRARVPQPGGARQCRPAARSSRQPRVREARRGSRRRRVERGDVGAMCGLTLRAAALLPEGDSKRLDLHRPARRFPQPRGAPR